MTHSGPLPLLPRLDPKPWGGRRLARFGFALPPDEPIGEALLTAGEAVVASGYHAGRALADLVAADPVGLCGARGLVLTRGMPLFPLLVKLIDAAEPLSVQVHPPDAAAPPGSLGKTEAWHVLDAAPGAVLYLGLNDGIGVAELEALARRGASTAGLLRAVPAVPGETVYLPAGTVHALGAGVLIYELQQPSAVTYRLDDWGRLDAAGRPRALHRDAALDVLDPASRPDPIPPLALPTDAGERTRLVASPWFALERLALPAGASTALSGEGAPQVVTCLAGAGTITTGGDPVAFAAGETVAVPAAAPAATLAATADAVLLRGWLDPSQA